MNAIVAIYQPLVLAILIVTAGMCVHAWQVHRHSPGGRKQAQRRAMRRARTLLARRRATVHARYEVLD